MSWFARRRAEAERRILTELGAPWGSEHSIIWHYGGDVMRRTRMRAGRFYLALGRLENAGRIEAKWDAREPNAKHRRRMYRLGMSTTTSD